MKKLMMFSLCMLVAASAAFAEDAKPRLIVSGAPTKVKLTLGEKVQGMYAKNPGYAKENKDFMINSYMISALEGDGWQEYKLSFTPDKNGRGFILLKATSDENWICWDDIKVEGAKILNGNFEDLNEEGLPNKWRPVKKENVIKEDGNTYVKVNNKNAIKCTIIFTAETPVTITAKVKKL